MQSIEAIAAQFRADNPHVEWTGDLDEVSQYSSYANPGYDSGIGVVIADWNDFPRGFDSAVESAGFVIDWSDEIMGCEECGRAIHTTPAFYGDIPCYAIVDDCCVLCYEHLDAESYLESLENNPRKALNVRGLNPADYGYTLVVGDFENGFHQGQTDDPAKIYAQLHHTHPRLLFYIDGTGQFDIHFSVWEKLA